MVLLDEAYVDFARENALALALETSACARGADLFQGLLAVLPARRISGRPPGLIAALHKIRDSYNVNGLGQIAALATLDDLPYYRANFKQYHRHPRTAEPTN